MTNTLEAELHRQLVRSNFGKKTQGDIMECFRNAQRRMAEVNPEPQVPMIRLVPAAVDRTQDLAKLLHRVIYATRKHLATDSPAMATVNVAWAYLVDKQLLGSPLRDAIRENGTPTPIDMVLHCPKCHTQHIDKDNSEELRIEAAELGVDREGDRAYSDWLEEREWLNPPHKTHQCQNKACGHEWRPANVPTNGVHDITPKEQSNADTTTA